MSAKCKDEELIRFMSTIFATNNSKVNYERALAGDLLLTCNSSKTNNMALDHYARYMDYSEYDTVPSNTFAYHFYAYLTPFIILIGICGNFASLCVFTSRRLRGLSASHYLAALSASDSTVLMTYVFLQWLNNGLQHWPGGHKVAVLNVEGICHLFLFISYAFRVISVYLVVVFTVERYIAVCKPLKRRLICTRSFAKKLILMVFTFGALISLYKPLLSGVYDIQDTSFQVSEDGTHTSHHSNQTDDLNSNAIVSDKACIRNPKYGVINFVFEFIYCLLITALPLFVMFIFNILIVHTLLTRMSDNKLSLTSTREHKIRWEFTVMLLSVSTCFILLNIPYFVVWMKQMYHSHHQTQDFTVIQTLRSHILITKTIFNLNYCINFFVYCLTGSYYRSVITDCFGYKRGGSEKRGNGYTFTRVNSLSHQDTVVVGTASSYETQL